MTSRLSRFSWLCLACTVLVSVARAQEDAAEDEVSAETEPQLPAAEESAPPASAKWSLQLSAEAGVGSRNVDVPRDAVIYEVRTGVYPALGVGFQLDYHSSERLSVGLVARYQSSIGLVLNEQLTDGTVHPRKSRSHVFEVGIAPTLYLGSSGWAIGGVLGYGITELDPENHLETPSYHLGGPHARLALHVPLGSERVQLVLAGEGQLTIQVGDELEARGASSSGWGAGASAAFELGINEHWTVALSYRELHYWLSSQRAASFADGLRFATVQLRGAL